MNHIDVQAILARQPQTVKAQLAYDPTDIAQTNAVMRVVVEARRPTLFAEMLAPRVFVGADQGTVILKGQVTNLEVDDRVGPAGAAAEGGRSLLSLPFQVQDHARVVRDPRADAARAPTLVSVAERSATARELIDRQKEVITFGVLANPASYLAANRVVVGAGFHWNGGGSASLSTVLANVQALRSKVRRGRKIVAAMSQDTWFKIQASALLMSLDAAPGLSRVLDLERFKAILGVDEVVVTNETVTTQAGEVALIPLGTIILVAVGTQGVGVANAPTALLAQAGFAHTVVRNLTNAAMGGADASARVTVDGEGYVVSTWSEPGGIAVVDCAKCGLAYVVTIVDQNEGAIMTGVVT